MKTKNTIGTLMLGAASILFSASASAAIVACNTTPGAEANANPAELCASRASAGGGSSGETTFVNSMFQGTGDAFTHIGKFDNDAGKEDQDGTGYELLVTPGNDDYSFGFSLTSTDFSGEIDFVLFVKQGSQPDYAYFWSGLLLDIEGFFNSFNINQGDAYSHISGFVRTGEPTTRVPEPATVLLLAAGLLGAAALRRRRAQPAA